MTPHQQKTLYLLNLIFGGLIFTSDNYADYDPERRQMYLAHFPMKEKNIDKVEYKGELMMVEFHD